MYLFNNTINCLRGLVGTVYKLQLAQILVDTVIYIFV